MSRLRFGWALLLVVPHFASAQADLTGKQRYPQFRVLSGLPGGGFGVTPDGKTSVMGAAALTTPIGYTMGTGSYAVGFFNTSVDSNPFKLDTNGIKSSGTTNEANGSAFLMFGLSYKGYRLTASNMILSTNLDNVFNFQFSPPPIGKLGFALGVQDAFDTGGASGEGLDTVDKISSRSLYVVGTYDFGHGVYATLGKGDRRFQGIIGNASAPITSRLRALVEYDGFNFNGGLLYGTGKGLRVGNDNARSELSFFLGTVRGKYGTVGLSFTL